MTASLTFGATLLAADRTRFRLWAPDRRSAGVEIDGAAPIAMANAGDGWFEAELPCGAGTRYRFRLTPDLAVPDPASRAQDGDVHDASIGRRSGGIPVAFSPTGLAGHGMKR